jgi:hypothetical protein
MAQGRSECHRDRTAVRKKAALPWEAGSADSRLFLTINADARIMKQSRPGRRVTPMGACHSYARACRAVSA